MVREQATRTMNRARDSGGYWLVYRKRGGIAVVGGPRRVGVAVVMAIR